MKPIILAPLVFIASCVSGVTMDQATQSWHGSDLNQVVSKWGFPHDEKTVAGHKQYSWTKEFIPISTFVNGEPQHRFYCTRTMIVNSSGSVVGSRSAGNNCPFDASQFSKDG